MKSCSEKHFNVCEQKYMIIIIRNENLVAPISYSRRIRYDIDDFSLLVAYDHTTMNTPVLV